MTAAQNGQMAQLDAIRALARTLQETELEVARCRARLNAAVRDAKGVSQADIAKACGLSRQRVGQIREQVPS